jgi:hypothetical protein
LVGWSDYADVAVKDFQTLGIVTLKSEAELKVGPLHLNKSLVGSTITYSMLLDEAKKLGAEDIINVRIDTTIKGETTIIDFIIGRTQKVIFTGTALAIKYTNAIERVKSANQEEIKF